MAAQKVTVAELIMKLNEFKQDAIVLLSDADTGWVFSDPICSDDGRFVLIFSAEDYGGKSQFHDTDEAEEHFK